MKALQSRAVAVIICIILVLGSAVVGTGTSLNTYRAQCEVSFREGAGRGDMGIQRDLSEIAAQSYNITVIAGHYLPATDANITGVLQKRDELAAAGTPKEKYKAAAELDAAVTVLTNTLQVLDVNAQHGDQLQKCLTIIDSARRTMKNSGYNTVATTFNNTLGRFPASVLGGLFGVQPLELFE